MDEFKLTQDYETPEGFEVPDHIDMWYDKHSRNWVVQLMDAYENQIENAIYVYSKPEAIKIKESLQKQYNIV